jgi:hypothetical protein
MVFEAGSLFAVTVFHPNERRYIKVIIDKY